MRHRRVAIAGVVLAGVGWAQVTERASVSSNGTQGNAVSALYGFSISSADGRFVAFGSLSSNLVPNDNNGDYDVFVRDRLSGTTELVSVSSGGIQGNAQSGERGSSISADGRWAVFESAASNLVPIDTKNAGDVFLHARQSGTTGLVSLSKGGVQGNSF